MNDLSQASRRAEDYAERAALAVTKLKPGTWESVLALATLSVAESLIAQNASKSGA